jgi:hypothetical protein
MKTKYQVNQNVKIKGGIEKLIITDFEIFEDIILYYTNNGSAYPEDMLEEEDCDNLDKNLTNFIQIFDLVITNYINNQHKNLVETEDRHNKILEKIKSSEYIQEIKNKIKNYQI